MMIGANMPRTKRVLLENGWYHVINRGAARRHLFLNNELKQVFLELLERVTPPVSAH